jgi:DNA polymerase (family 10)
MKTCIDPDGHETGGLDDVRWGIGVARRGWCTAADVLNAWSLERLLHWLEERKGRARRRGARG